MKQSGRATIQPRVQAGVFVLMSMIGAALAVAVSTWLEAEPWADDPSQLELFAAEEKRFAAVRAALLDEGLPEAANAVGNSPGLRSARPILGYLALGEPWQSNEWETAFFRAQWMMAPIPIDYHPTRRFLLANFPDEASLNDAIRTGGYHVVGRFGPGVAVLESFKNKPASQPGAAAGRSAPPLPTSPARDVLFHHGGTETQRRKLENRSFSDTCAPATKTEGREKPEFENNLYSGLSPCLRVSVVKNLLTVAARSEQPRAGDEVRP